MLTFASIAGGTASDTAGLATYMATSQSLTPAMDRSAKYYQTGGTLAPGEPVVSDKRIRMFAEVVARDAMPEDRAFNALATNVLGEVGDRTLTQPPPVTGPPEDAAARTFGWMVAVGKMDRDEAIEAMVDGDRARNGAAPGWDWKAVEDRVTTKIDAAERDARKAEHDARVAATAKLRA